MTRVVWTEEETLKVAQAYFDLGERNELPGRSEDGWRKAQETALPNQPTRWRPFSSSAAASAMNAKLREFSKSGRITRTTTKVIQQPKPEVKVVVINGSPVARDTYELCVNHFKSTNPPPKTLDDYFRSMIADEVKAALPSILQHHQESLGNMVKESMQSFMKFLDPNFKDTPEQVEIGKEAIPAPPTHLPVVVLVNANSAQMQSVQEAFPQYEVRAVQDRVPGETHPLLVVGFTKFMNRSVDEACAKKYADAYLRVGAKGAASEAKRLIEHRLRHFHGN